MAISRLARFHAISYAMRMEQPDPELRDMTKTYPFLREDPVYRPETKELFAKTQSSISTRLFNIFQHSNQELKDFSNYFMDAVKVSRRQFCESDAIFECITF